MKVLLLGYSDAARRRVRKALRKAGVRLVRDSFNATSPLLYDSLGFKVKGPPTLIEGVPNGELKLNLYTEPRAVDTFGKKI